MSQAPLLLEVSELQSLMQQRDDLLVIDVSSPENYLKAHIPGALHLPPGALLCGYAPAPGKLPDKAHLQELFSGLGLDERMHVVAYDDEGGGWAGRLLWTLEVLGHQNYSYLNGGIHAWKGEGMETTSEVSQAAPSHYQVTIQRGPIADIEDILARLGDPALGIWDARSAEEYRGERAASARSGHIPGAINLDWLELIDRNNATRLVNLQQMQQRLDELGLSADKDIITHCQSHHRSSLSWLAMKILGYPSARGYDGSWGEWGNREDTPIEV